MGILRQLDAKLPDGYRTWDEAQWRTQVVGLLSNSCFQALQSPTVRTIKEVLTFFVNPVWLHFPARKYQSCIIFLFWKLRCHIVHRAAADTLLITFAEMPVTRDPVGNVLRSGQTVVAWRTAVNNHVYYSFAANETASAQPGSINRLKLEADAAETGVYVRLDPGSTNAAFHAMQAFGAFLSTTF